MQHNSRVCLLEEMELLPSGTWEKLQDRGLQVRNKQEELDLKQISQRYEQERIDFSVLSKVLNTIKIKGRYIPPKNDPLRNWWTNAS